MTKPLKPGPKTLAEKSGEETRQLKILITQSQYDFLMSQDRSASSFVRYMIEGARKAQKLMAQGVSPDDLPTSEILEQAHEEQDRLDDLLNK